MELSHISTEEQKEKLGPLFHTVAELDKLADTCSEELLGRRIAEGLLELTQTELELEQLLEQKHRRIFAEVRLEKQRRTWEKSRSSETVQLIFVLAECMLHTEERTGLLFLVEPGFETAGSKLFFELVLVLQQTGS